MGLLVNQVKYRVMVGPDGWMAETDLKLITEAAAESESR